MANFFFCSKLEEIEQEQKNNVNNFDYILSCYKHNIKCVFIKESKIINQVDDVKDMNCVKHT